MISSMTTRIVFSEGANVTVTSNASEVREALAQDKKDGQPFTQLQEQGGRDVYVAADRVAYITALSSYST
jgi:hypothetical protein